ncbi:hypothetical protein LBMAG53_24460 [Planctomycetota bacterium]|nr:hypothetical protein LBMAG53_24460 [Planctomycetota bacterium]
MAGHTTTVQRLERQLQLEHARALSALHERYTALCAELFPAARARGYAGVDPVEAVRSLVSDPPALAEVGRAAADLWLTFFGCFRDDEAAYEAKQFRERADPLNRRLAQRQPGAAPDGPTTLALLDALDTFVDERHAAVSARIDALLAEIAKAQGEVRKATLGAAHGSDELARVEGSLDQALTEVGAPAAAGASALEKLAVLVARLREDAAGARVRADHAAHQLARLVGVLRGESDLGDLPPEVLGVLAEIRRLAQARSELERANRELYAKQAESEGGRRELVELLAAAERRLRGLGDADEERGEDRRLELYRRFAAAVEAGQDWKSALEKVRSLERVLTLDHAAQQRLVKVADRQLASLAQTLAELRAIQPITDDPRRLRPRWFGGDYDFRSLNGILRPLAAAAADLAQYGERARWAAGVQALAKHVPKLRAVFRELVKLVAAWRAKLGDPPPASLSISIDPGSGLLALPAILAADLDLLLKRRKAASAALELAPLIDAGVGLYHQAVTDAKGAAPTRVPAPKRESAAAAVARLAGELTALAGMLETSFSEAASDDFRLLPPDAALLSDDHLLRLGLSQLDTVLAELAAAPGAPTSKAATPARGDPQALRMALQERADWLELLTRYRIETPPGA